MAGKIRPRVRHGDEYSINRKRRVKLLFRGRYGVQQIIQAVRRIRFGLYRNDDPVRSSHCIDR